MTIGKYDYYDTDGDKEFAMQPSLPDDPDQYHQNARVKSYDDNGILIDDHDIEGCIADWHASKKEKAKECDVNINETMSECLYKAIVHAEAVSKREHHKSDRQQRVNHFITSLRRFLCQTFTDITVRKNFTDWLCTASTWYDIGHPNPAGFHTLYGKQHSLQDLLRWCGQAKGKMGDVTFESIEAELELLKADADSFKPITDDMERINKESDELIASLERDVFDL